jgi:predicted nucleic acid-binding protein
MIVDSSILIHLSRIGRLELLKGFGVIRITEDVHRETVKEQRGKPGTSSIKDACNSWIEICKVGDKIREVAEQDGIEEADASLILLAEEKKDILISNDYFLIRAARGRGIECWWLTTLLLKAVEREIVEKEEAKQILLELIEGGMRLSVEVYAAILRRIDKL